MSVISCDVGCVTPSNLPGLFFVYPVKVHQRTTCSPDLIKLTNDWCRKEYNIENS